MTNSTDEARVYVERHCSQDTPVILQYMDDIEFGFGNQLQVVMADIAYWEIFYNALEEELIKRGYYQ